MREDEDGRTKRPRIDETTDQSLPVFKQDVPTSSSTTGISTPTNAKVEPTVDAVTRRMCSSCLEIHSRYDMLELPCKGDNDFEPHAYCRECLRGLFESSVTDPSHFPPRCCSKIIPLFGCMPFLPATLVARFVSRREELETPNRTYCSDAKCSKWIRSADIKVDVAKCAHCAQETCALCKGKAHTGSLCPEDQNVKELLNVARQKRWQTCPNCKEMVELEQGCYHITCRCRHEFCYLCKAQWRTCNCPVWDERNIVELAPGVANAAQPAAQPIAAPVAAPVAQPVPAATAGRNRGNRRNRRNRAQNRPHEHNFERFYRSGGWNTECHRCGHADRWVNCCDTCDIKLCWYCTKHPA
ncbi:hypothetical protein T440DRAFT_456062 [Plenodomus tracheiphilus IPT5]|uniref:RBR-type E3 ubiquitin transferase n=1 Tax=Plenodomus tracheiphilus IPT5 TaxID=1408161 RepID=A0A6A7AZ02_9PLEO|nr:hypothetical protein T440DRAFT_456062 [Plenodomus tracheiphilus IPT5]